MPVLSKMSQCAWSFPKLFCWLTVGNKTFFDHHNCRHFFFNTIKALIIVLHCYLLCHRCLLRVSAGQNQLTKEKTNPRSVWPLTLSIILLLSLSQAALNFTLAMDVVITIQAWPFSLSLPALKLNAFSRQPRLLFSFPLSSMTRNVDSLAWWP